MIPQTGEAQAPEATIPERRLYPLKEAAEQLGGITERMLWTLVMRGDIRSVKVGRRRMIPASALDQYVSELEEAAA